MKGRLYKTEKGWYVSYNEQTVILPGIKNVKGSQKKIQTTTLIPLHPKDTNYYDSEYEYYGEIGLKPEIVEFDIVKEYTDDYTNQVQKYAKLRKPTK